MRRTLEMTKGGRPLVIVPFCLLVILLSSPVHVCDCALGSIGPQPSTLDV